MILNFEDIKSLNPYYTSNQNQFFNNLSPLINLIHKSYDDELKSVYLKYRDNLSIVDSDSFTKNDFFIEMVKEKEYKKLLDILNLNTNDLAIIYSYLKIFQFLKGTRNGLNVIFNLLGFSDLNNLPLAIRGFLIKEWWEVIPEEERMTFDLDLIIPYDEYITGFTSKLKEFIKSYVYPKLKRFNIIHAFSFNDLKINNAVYLDEEIEDNSSIAFLMLNTALFMDIEINSIYNPPEDIFIHDFNTINGINDLTPNNNNWVNSLYVNAIFNHNFLLSNPYNDFSLNNNDYISFSFLPQKETFTHEFALSNPLIDNTGNGNNWIN